MRGFLFLQSIIARRISPSSITHHGHRLFVRRVPDTQESKTVASSAFCLKMFVILLYSNLCRASSRHRALRKHFDDTTYFADSTSVCAVLFAYTLVQLHPAKPIPAPYDMYISPALARSPNQKLIKSIHHFRRLQVVSLYFVFLFWVTKPEPELQQPVSPTATIATTELAGEGEVSLLALEGTGPEKRGGTESGGGGAGGGVLPMTKETISYALTAACALCLSGELLSKVAFGGKVSAM